MKIYFIFLIAAFLTGDADDHERYSPTATIMQAGDVTNINQSSGAALGIATAQHQFYLETDDLQGSIGAGTYDGNSAISFALAKRFKGILLNGSVGGEAGEYGAGVGANWRW